ncbi:MAG: HlyD family efflux transporter periplasmic adaptor subunit [Clostridia bacterium]
MSKLAEKKTTATIHKKTTELQVLFNKKQIVLGQINNVQAIIDELTAKRDELVKKTGNNSISSVTSPYSGYFSSSFDGYENILSPKFLLEGGYEKYKEVMDSTPNGVAPKDYVCKINASFTWYFACTVPKDSLKRYSVGDQISLRLSSLSNDTMPANFAQITPMDDFDYIVFSSNSYSSDLLKARKLKAQIVTKKYTGFRVNKNAIRIQNDKKGVFSLRGSQVQFKEVNVLFMKDEYVIIKQTENSKTNLLAGEEVVVSGKNLFDGKIIS